MKRVVPKSLLFLIWFPLVMSIYTVSQKNKTLNSCQ